MTGGRARSAARAARLGVERARFAAWARRLDAALRRAGGRLALDAPHGAHFYELPHIEVHPYGGRAGTLTLRVGRHARLGRGLILDVWAAADNVLELGDAATFRAGTRVQLHGGKVSIGARTTIRDYCFLDASQDGSILIGDDVEIGQQVAVHAVDRVRLGDRVAAGERVSVFDSDHRHDGSDVKAPDQAIAVTPVDIGPNTFLGAGTFVLRGVRMGANAMVAAGALVRAGDYEGGFLYAGSPLRAVRPLGAVPGSADRDVSRA
jgi:carbonic anhydrase/acetyltransferase-like protein (isoleucine patch superfamily)